MHSHDIFFRASKTLLDIAMHSLWYHPRQESHRTHGVVHWHSLEQIRQGNFRVGVDVPCKEQEKGG